MLQPGLALASVRDPDRFAQLVRAAELGVRDRHALYEQLAQVRYPGNAAPADPDQEPSDG